MSDAPFAGRTLLVVGGGIEAVPGLARLRALGATLVVSDRDPHAPGFAEADERLVASTMDAEASVAAARAANARRRIDGVLCIAADVPVTVAAIADALGLPGLPVEAARRANDKLAMKEALRAGGVPVPEFAPIAEPAALRRWLDAHGAVVVKPVDSRGARGVQILRGGADLEAAFAAARAASPTGRVMVERFVPGPQLSSESFVLADGSVATPGLADRNYELLERCAPWVIENGGLQPSIHHAAWGGAADALLARVAAALALPGGVLKGDLVLEAGRGLVVIEVAARLSGGAFCTVTIPHSTGVDLVAAQARFALGLPVPRDAVTPRALRPVANRYFLPEPGTLVAVHGYAEAARRPGIVHAELFVRPGDRIRPLVDHTCRAGSVVATGDDAAQAIARAESAVRSVRFLVRPDEPIQEKTDAALPRHRLAG